MKAKTVTFKEIEEEHRRERAEDARRLASHLVTKEELQEENSLVPKHVPIRIENLAAYARRVYSY